MKKEIYKGVELVFNLDGTVETNVPAPIIGVLTTVHESEEVAKGYVDNN